MEILSNAAKAGTLTLPTWGFDPALVIALRYALAENLVIQISNGYQLSAKGLNFVNLLMSDLDIFVQERAELAQIGSKITETMVERVAKDWD